MNTVNLRKWQLEDVMPLAKYLNNKNIWNNCRDGLPHPYLEEHARSFIDSVILKEEQSDFCIDLNGEAIGNIGFTRGKDVERFNAELGYWLAEPYWNKGIMTRMLSDALTDYFQQTNVVRIYASVFETNIASMRVLEKVGFRKVGVFGKSCYKNESFLDAHYYELLSDRL